MILAILKAQFLSMRLRPGTRKGSAIFGSITGLAFYGFFAFFGWLAMLFFSAGNETPVFIAVLSIVLPLLMAYWQLAPVISASFGASLDLSKLRAYPIPRSKLFTVEVLLRITTCGELLLLLGGMVTGLLRNPQLGWRVAPSILTGTLLFVATNIFFSAGTRSLLERLVRRARLREMLMILLVLVSIAPQIALATKMKKGALLGFSPSQIFWPWGAFAHLATGDAIALSALSAVVWLGVAIVFSRWQFERSLAYDGSTVRKRDKDVRPDGALERIFRLPGRFLPDPLGALVEKELRTLSRIARFRLVYGMSCFFGVAAMLPVIRRGNHGFGAENAVTLMALYGLMMLGQITFWNSFGFDRTAVQGYFSWPVRFRSVLLAKNLTVVALLIPQVIIVSVVCRLVKLPVGPVRMLEALFVVTIAATYWFAMGNICSVRIPRALDPDKMNQMANKMQALTIFTMPILLLPIGLAYWARWFFESQIVFIGLMAVAALIGGIFYWVGLDSAVATATGVHREKMLLELSRSDGPLSIT
jgi:ABC-2 type transport system permease protein